MTKLTFWVLAVGLLSVPVAGWAQGGPPVRVRGTVESLSDHSLTVMAKDGAKMTITLTEPFSVTAPKKLQLSDIKTGDYLGIAGEPTKGGEADTTALVVQIFNPAAKGPEGRGPYDLTPTSTMTNGPLTAENLKGRMLTLSFKGNTSTFEVPPNAIVYTPVAATQADIKPGVKVFLYAVRGADGTLSTGRLMVGKDGFDPPS